MGSNPIVSATALGDGAGRQVVRLRSRGPSCGAWAWLSRAAGAWDGRLALADGARARRRSRAPTRPSATPWCTARAWGRWPKCPGTWPPRGKGDTPMTALACPSRPPARRARAWPALGGGRARLLALCARGPHRWTPWCLPWASPTAWARSRPRSAPRHRTRPGWAARRAPLRCPTLRRIPLRRRSHDGPPGRAGGQARRGALGTTPPQAAAMRGRALGPPARDGSGAAPQGAPDLSRGVRPSG